MRPPSFELDQELPSSRFSWQDGRGLHEVEHYSDNELTSYKWVVGSQLVKITFLFEQGHLHHVIFESSVVRQDYHLPSSGVKCNNKGYRNGPESQSWACKIKSNHYCLSRSREVWGVEVLWEIVSNICSTYSGMGGMATCSNTTPSGIVVALRVKNELRVNRSRKHLKVVVQRKHGEWQITQIRAGPPVLKSITP